MLIEHKKRKEADKKNAKLWRKSEKGKASIKKYEEQRYNNPEKTSQRKEYLKNHRQQPKKCEICKL